MEPALLRTNGITLDNHFPTDQRYKSGGNYFLAMLVTRVIIIRLLIACQPQFHIGTQRKERPLRGTTFVVNRVGEHRFGVLLIGGHTIDFTLQNGVAGRLGNEKFGIVGNVGFRNIGNVFEGAHQIEVGKCPQEGYFRYVY